MLIDVDSHLSLWFENELVINGIVQFGASILDVPLFFVDEVRNGGRNCYQSTNDASPYKGDSVIGWLPSPSRAGLD